MKQDFSTTRAREVLATGMFAIDVRELESFYRCLDRNQLSNTKQSSGRGRESAPLPDGSAIHFIRIH